MIGVVLNDILVRSLTDAEYEVRSVGGPAVGKGQTEDGNVTYRISGSTYPVKEILKTVGCRWNSQDKCWFTRNKEWQKDAIERACGDEKTIKRLKKLTTTAESKSEKGSDNVIVKMVESWKSKS